MPEGIYNLKWPNFNKGSFRSDEINRLIKLFLVGLIAINFLLLLGQLLVVLEGVNDMRSDKNDHIAFFIILSCFAKSSSDPWEASEARQPGLVLRLGIADHPAEDEEVLVGHVNMGCHIRLGRADPVDLRIGVHRVMI